MKQLRRWFKEFLDYKIDHLNKEHLLKTVEMPTEMDLPIMNCGSFGTAAQACGYYTSTQTTTWLTLLH